ncbi:hypothetical protein [Erythrobacter sp. 3-20A1M]|uniref:hypothetical protein n=1 Tax=Erythrobacter sp. 3-20A1M TaxID=2653850 RepID=UPI00204187E5|nr:hypothetical protein [Erythrobacter sp. 3-20A1M]
MATGKRKTTRRKARSTSRGGRWLWVLLVVLLLAAVAYAFWGETLRGYGRAGTAYGARVACSCRYVEGRTLADCKKDKLAGMELVFLSDDDTEKSVTATFPLVASDTARLRDGYGCVLVPWKH